ncbi:protein scribble homolog isoform X1 [Polyergus mexicanus]|uniref:protein scribble homolog isoform X1 n=1 Tax=Polyergus mexicanus TaxID=615972 RepID=UPI0038B5EC0C
MDSNMSTAAFMHRSGGSSSASNAGTGSSTGGGPGNPAGGGRMAVIGVTRNVRLRRRGNAGFGFSLRGGREYAAGFYVSDVQPGGEAHRNGLRVGDQILRVNGYPVEDAVHQEVALLAKNQQVLVLKIRSVGMIPVKDNPNDPVTWHMVQQQQQQLQYNETGLGNVPNAEVRIRILVGEKGRLGCGVCRGIVPGLTVQGTREGGPARAAGLKAGDVIIWCNGQRLTDLPFERAIEMMRSSAILDLVVQRPAVPNHLYDCPEPLWTRGSSGYDSETSSVVAASPLSQHPNNAPSSPQHHHHDGRMNQRYPRDDACNRNGRICCPLALSTNSCSSSSEWAHVDQAPEWSRKPNNTTVIRVNQSSNQNHRPIPGGQYHFNSRGNYEDDIDNEPLYDPVAPRIDYEVHDFDANPRDEANRRLAYRRDNARQQQDVIYDGPADDLPMYHGSKENGQAVGNRLTDLQLAQRQSEAERKTTTTVEVHQSVCPPAPPPPLPYKWPAETKPMNAMGMQMGSTMSMGSTGSTETESSLESSCSKDSASTSSSLSTSSCEPASTVSYGSANGGGSSSITSKTTDTSTIAYTTPRKDVARTSPIASTDLSTAITQELQRRAQQRMNNAAKAEMPKDKTPDNRKPQNLETLRSQEQKVTHDKLMEEFKRAHQKMFNSAQQKVQSSDQILEKEQEKKVLYETSTTMTAATTTTMGSPMPPPVPPPLPLPSKNRGNDDSVEMQSIESFKLKEAPNTVPKPPPTYFPVTSPASNGSPHHIGTGSKVPKDAATSPVAELAKTSLASISPTNGAQISKSLTGNKVAVRIGAYEGETKQPSRLEFLPQQPSRDRNGVVDEAANSPVVSRLQNELVATLQRSNLRRKTEGVENQSPVKTISENAATPSNNTTNSEPNKLLQGNVEKLASALSNKVTIRVNPENGSR